MWPPILISIVSRKRVIKNKKSNGILHPKWTLRYLLCKFESRVKTNLQQLHYSTSYNPAALQVNHQSSSLNCISKHLNNVSVRRRASLFWMSGQAMQMLNFTENWKTVSKSWVDLDLQRSTSKSVIVKCFMTINV